MQCTEKLISTEQLLNRADLFHCFSSKATLILYYTLEKDG